MLQEMLLVLYYSTALTTRARLCVSSSVLHPPQLFLIARIRSVPLLFPVPETRRQNIFLKAKNIVALYSFSLKSVFLVPGRHPPVTEPPAEDLPPTLPRQPDSA